MENDNPLETNFFVELKREILFAVIIHKMRKKYDRELWRYN